MADLALRLEPVARALLESDETLVGCCVATWQRTFTGGLVAIAVSPSRIVVQRVDRRFAPAEAPVSIPPERLARATVSSGVGGSVSIPSILMEAVSITVDLTTTDGIRLRLMLMGSGGQIQHDGIHALLAYLEPIGDGA
jgi:hypothetical protein